MVEEFVGALLPGELLGEGAAVGPGDIEGFQRGGAKILSDVSLTVRAGEIYGLIGPNGAGKTTTLAVVVGLAQQPTGREACAAAGVSEAELPAYARALETLAQTGMITERTAS